MDATIAIVSNRDPEKFLIPTLDDISNASDLGYKYEIIVYGPQSINIDSRIDRFFEERERQGNIYGYNLLTKHARGRNVIYLTDDMIIPDNLFFAVNYLDKMDSRIKIAGFRMRDILYSPFPNGLITEKIGWSDLAIKLKGDVIRYHGPFAIEPPNKITIARFIAGCKADIDKYMDGYLFHPSFRQGGGDQYLAIWLWTHGESIKEDIPVFLQDRLPASVAEYKEKDAEVLRDLIDKLALGYRRYV